MAAKDVYHDAVKNALIKDGWTITDEPLTLSLGLRNLFVDLGAEKVLAAAKDGKRIAVEVKSFVGRSTIVELEKAIGQYVLYSNTLTMSATESDRQLFLALPRDVIEELADDKILPMLTTQFTPHLNLLVYHPTKQLIEQWILPPTHS